MEQYENKHQGKRKGFFCFLSAREERDKKKGKGTVERRSGNVTEKDEKGEGKRTKKKDGRGKR